MDTGGDFPSLVHKPAETPNYNLDCSPANPTPYEPPFEFTGFKMAGFGADGPPYPLSGTPNGNMNSSFMPRGAGVFEDVSTCLSRSSLVTIDNENFLAIGARTCWQPRLRNYGLTRSSLVSREAIQKDSRPGTTGIIRTCKK